MHKHSHRHYVGHNENGIAICNVVVNV